MRIRSSLALAAALPLALAGCAGAPAATPASSTPAKAPTTAASPATASAPVAVATTTQLGSLLSDITKCAGTTSTTLMPAGADPHDFAPSSEQVAGLTKAKLVVANGLGLEGGMQSTLDAVKKDGATVFEVAPQLSPLSYEEIEKAQAAQHAGHDHAKDEHGHEGHDHGTHDPHVALDAGRMATAANVIGAQLAQVTGDDKYKTCGAEVETKIKGTDAEVKKILSAIPKDRRVLVTDHEAYNYFAKAYDFEVAGVVVKGGSTDAEPSSAELAELVEVIKEDKVPAIFSNTAVSPKTVQAVAKETGTNIKVVDIFVDSLGAPGSGADTYDSMMRTNAQRIADALK